MVKSSANKSNTESDGSNYKIITDEPAKDASDFRNYSQRLSQIIVKSIPQFTVGIFGGWGTGKTSMMQMIKDEIDKNYSDAATTIWFDSWRYEREEYSLMIPLLRTIILTLHNVIDQITDDKKKEILRKVTSGFVKMIKAVARGTGINLGGEIDTGIAKVNAGLSLDFEKILNEYEDSSGEPEKRVYVNQKKIIFHKHVSDYLKEELDNIKNKHRLMIFIDDLDRCIPDRALEILESIKTFFDIEGIIYVIGMDPATIDDIIHTKYGENSKIDGLDYLQKIVQLPFQIPLWSDNDLTDAINEMTKTTGLPKDVTEKLLEHEEIKDLIIKSAKLNPRNIKRFINSLVLSYDTDDQNLKDIDDEKLKNYIIENYLKSMISIQTFYFRGEKWLQFVKMIMDYNDRIQFLTHFITFIEFEKITSYHDLEDKIKDIPTRKYPKHNKKILEIYNKIIEINDEDLFTFLTQAAEPLLRIGNIENYLRAVDTKKDIDTTKNILEIKSYESINKLQHGTLDFTKYVQNSIIHLPYLPYWELELDKGKKLEKINLSGAFLFKADLSKANLTAANLKAADLSGANLTAANLKAADLSGADLSGADLKAADLKEADLSWADFLGADLKEADLSGADLSGANLTAANLTAANLTAANLKAADLKAADLLGADLSKANLTAANLSGANLLSCDLSGAKLTAANLSGANLSGADLLGANLTAANLTAANLTAANLTAANLTAANLSEANLIHADLSNSIIISLQNFESSKLNEKSNFANAISNDSNIIYRISQFTRDIPEIINTKKELKLKLDRRELGKEYIESVLTVSKLPEK